MKKIFLVLTVMILCMTTVGFSKSENWRHKRQYDQCKQQFQERILNEIITQFKLDLRGYKELTSEELNELYIEKQMNGNKAFDLETLKHLFIGSSIGGKKLFIKDNPGHIQDQGFIIYKTGLGNNMIKEITKTNNIWLVTSEDERPARKPTYPCSNEKPPIEIGNEHKKLPDANKFYNWLDRKEYSEFENATLTIRKKVLYKDAKRLLKQVNPHFRGNSAAPDRQVYVFATMTVVDAKEKYRKRAWAVYDAETGFAIESGKGVEKLDMNKE